MDYKVGNYTFSDEETAKKAGKEAETINFIRSRSDLSKPDNITKIINTIVDNKMFETQVGLDFLEELRELERRGDTAASPVTSATQANYAAPAASANSANSGNSSENESENPENEAANADNYSDEPQTFAPADEEVIRAEVIRRTKHLKETAEERVEKIREVYKDKERNLRIVVFALLAVIVGLIMLTFFSDNSPFINAEQKVINEYSEWQEQLTQKEEELKAREKELERREEQLNK